MTYRFDEEDRSYPHPALQLVWRLDDLLERREQLRCMGASGRSDVRLSAEDVRYALAEDLDALHDVETAIGFAKEDLLELYGIRIEDAQESPANAAGEHRSFALPAFCERNARTHSPKPQEAA